MVPRREAPPLSPRSRSGWAALALLFSLAFAGPVKADLWTVNQGSGNNQLYGTAEFTVVDTVDGTFLQVVLTNLLTDQRSSGQAIRGLQFAVSNASGSPNLIEGTGEVGNLPGPSAGTIQNLLSNAGGKPWTASGSASAVELITNPAGPGGPNRLIAGYPSTNYNNGIGSHNPYVLNSATFLFAFNGLTLSSKISNVSIGFGTDYSKWTTAEQVAAVPEPSTLAIASLGAAAFFGHGLRRRRAAKASS